MTVANALVANWFHTLCFFYLSDYKSTKGHQPTPRGHGVFLKATFLAQQQENVIQENHFSAWELQKRACATAWQFLEQCLVSPKGCNVSQCQMFLRSARFALSSSYHDHHPSKVRREFFKETVENGGWFARISRITLASPEIAYRLHAY